MSAPRALFAALAFALSACDACAHASLVSTVPQDGAVLAAAPVEAVLRFDEPVSALVVRLLDDTGAAVELPAVPRAEGQTIRVELPPRMREGTYLLSYRVTSADSHPVGGSIALSVGRMSSPVHAEPAGIADGSGWRVAVRAARDIALLISAGCAMFLLFVSPFPGERQVLVIAGCAAAVFSMAGVGLQGVALIGHGHILALDSWRVAMRTTYGLSAIVAAGAALMIAFAAGLERGGTRGALLAAGALAAAASLPLTGHAASASPVALARLAIGAHALAAAFWAGSLVALYVMLRRGTGEIAQALRRFSRIALAAVALLILAGAGFAVLQLDSLADLVHTRYGNLILVKTALLAVLLAVATRNRFVLLPSLERAVPGAGRRLRRAIAAEIALVALVVSVTAVLVQTQLRAASIVKKELTSGSRAATLTVTPGRPGHNEIAVLFRDSQGMPFDPTAAVLDISNPGAGVEAITRSLLPTGRGSYHYAGGELAFAGSWRVEIRARIGDFESVSLAAVVEIR